MSGVSTFEPCVWVEVLIIWGRCMSAAPPHNSTATILPAWVRAIEALPNLHTLQIGGTHRQISTLLKNAFEGHIFPQVRTISLPSHAHHILRCCPEVKKVISSDRLDSRSLVSAIAKHCKKVEEVQGFRASLESIALHLFWQLCTY